MSYLFIRLFFHLFVNRAYIHSWICGVGTAWSVCSTSYGLEDPRLECRRGQDFYLLSKRPEWLCGSHSLLFNGHRGQNSRDMKLTTNLNLAPRLTVNGALPPFHLYAFMVGTGSIRISLPPPPLSPPTPPASYFFIFFFCYYPRTVIVFPSFLQPSLSCATCLRLTIPIFHVSFSSSSFHLST